MDKVRFLEWTKSTIRALDAPIVKEHVTQLISDVKEHDPEASQLLQNIVDGQDKLSEHLKKRLG